MNPVLVLHAALPEGPAPSALRRLLEELPYARRLELERREERDRCASLAGLHLALTGATRLLERPVSPGELQFIAGAKPRLAAGPHFSLSHGPTRVGVALSVAADVGFDLEELHDGEGTPRPDAARLVRWTATEAVLKAAGRGLRDTRAVRLDDDLAAGRLDGRVYRLRLVELHSGTIAHLAATEVSGPIEIEEIVLPRD
jgi:phosphopantetheinyl transferase